MLCGDAEDALDVSDEVRVAVRPPFHRDVVHLQATMTACQSSVQQLLLHLPTCQAIANLQESAVKMTQQDDQACHLPIEGHTHGG